MTTDRLRDMEFENEIMEQRLVKVLATALYLYILSNVRQYVAYIIYRILFLTKNTYVV